MRFLVLTILKQDKIVKLHLKPFCSGNLVHFQLNKENQTSTVRDASVETNFNLAHAYNMKIIKYKILKRKFSGSYCFCFCDAYT